MIRRRDLLACFTVCAVSAAWSALVVVYCIGTSRRQIADRHTVEGLAGRIRLVEEASERLASAIDALQGTATNRFLHAREIQEASNIRDSDEPRVLGRGTTRGPRSLWLYEDLEWSDGSTQRRYLLRLPLSVSSNAPPRGI